MEHRNLVLDTVRLANGLTVQFVDRSRTIAGDRFQARLVIRVPLEPTVEHFSSFSDPAAALADFASLCPTPGYEAEKVRNFVDRDLVDEIVTAMKQDFITAGLRYIERPGFAVGWISGEYEKLRREREVREAHEKFIESGGK